MRRLLLALALLAAPLHAQIAFVAAGGAVNAATGNPLIVTATLANGNTHVVVTCVDRTSGNTTQIVSSVVDSLGSSSYVFRDSVTDANDSLHVEIWSTSAGGGTAASGVKVTVNAGAYYNSEALDYSGVVALGTVANGNGTGTAASQALVTQDANNFVVGQLCGVGHGNGQSLTIVTGNNRAHDNSAGTNPGSMAIDNTAASASSVTIAATLSTGIRWVGDALELRSTTGGGGGGATAGGWIP